MRMTFGDFLRNIRAVIKLAVNVHIQGGKLNDGAKEGNPNKVLRALEEMRSLMEHALRKANALIGELSPEINDSDKIASELKESATDRAERLGD